MQKTTLTNGLNRYFVQLKSAYNHGFRAILIIIKYQQPRNADKYWVLEYLIIQYKTRFIVN